MRKKSSRSSSRRGWDEVEEWNKRWNRLREGKQPPEGKYMKGKKRTRTRRCRFWR